MAAQRRHTRNRAQHGFTSLGLLGVFALLLFVVGSIAMFAYALNARAAMGCDAAVQSVRTAVVAYHAQHDAYPADQSALVAAGILPEIVPELDFTSTPEGPPVYGTGQQTCADAGADS